MLYLPETYYLINNSETDLKKIALITAQTVSQWCFYYRVELISPLKNIPPDQRKKSGPLPENSVDKKQFIHELVNWLFDSSKLTELFILFFDIEPIDTKKKKPLKFDHHDDQCCWVLNLSKEEFLQLQNTWRDNGLPTDLFYPQGKEIRIPIPAGIIRRFFEFLGFQGTHEKIYTPKQWEMRNEIK